MAEFDTGFAAIAGRFGQVEPRRQARAFLLGLLSDVDTRSCWQLAEQAGDVSPHPMQRLLGEAVWDADAVRDDVRGYAVDALAGPDGDQVGDLGGVLILDDTGDEKKGQATVGVQRQYTGTAGRVENAQAAVYLAYATPAGSALIDRDVYLPRSWTDDPARCAGAGVPDRVRFATKITLGRRMLVRALDAGVPAAWADEFYGGDQHLRRDLQTRGIGYVLAVAKCHRVTARAADGPLRADRLVAALPARRGTGGRRDGQSVGATQKATGSRTPLAGMRWYLLSMSQPSPERIEPSPNAERLRIAMGWDSLPEVTPEERAEFRAELARRDEEIRRFYGKPAA